MFAGSIVITEFKTEPNTKPRTVITANMIWMGDGPDPVIPNRLKFSTRNQGDQGMIIVGEPHPLLSPRYTTIPATIVPDEKVPNIRYWTVSATITQRVSPKIFCVGSSICWTPWVLPETYDAPDGAPFDVEVLPPPPGSPNSAIGGVMTLPLYLEDPAGPPIMYWRARKVITGLPQVAVAWSVDSNYGWS